MCWEGKEPSQREQEGQKEIQRVGSSVQALVLGQWHKMMGLLPREAGLKERLNGLNKSLMWGYDVRSEFIGEAHDANLMNECK